MIFPTDNVRRAFFIGAMFALLAALLLAGCATSGSQPVPQSFPPMQYSEASHVPMLTSRAQPPVANNSGSRETVFNSAPGSRQ